MVLGLLEFAGREHADSTSFKRLGGATCLRFYKPVGTNVDSNRREIILNVQIHS